MTKREAKRIAYRNITDGASSELANGADYWNVVPGSTDGEPFSDEDQAKVEAAAHEIFDALEKRAIPQRNAGAFRDRMAAHAKGTR